jgi:CBS domain-containing protein
VPVSEIMTTSVFTCLPTDSVDSLAATMTERRIRHMPVVVDGSLVGIVSIGDVVKSRIGELESDREQLESYIAGG